MLYRYSRWVKDSVAELLYAGLEHEVHLPLDIRLIELFEISFNLVAYIDFLLELDLESDELALLIKTL